MPPALAEIFLPPVENSFLQVYIHLQKKSVNAHRDKICKSHAHNSCGQNFFGNHFRRDYAAYTVVQVCYGIEKVSGIPKL